MNINFPWKFVSTGSCTDLINVCMSACSDLTNDSGKFGFKCENIFEKAFQNFQFCPQMVIYSNKTDFTGFYFSCSYWPSRDPVLVWLNLNDGDKNSIYILHSKCLTEFKIWGCSSLSHYHLVSGNLILKTHQIKELPPWFDWTTVETLQRTLQQAKPVSNTNGHVCVVLERLWRITNVNLSFTVSKLTPFAITIPSP